MSSDPNEPRIQRTRFTQLAQRKSKLSREDIIRQGEAAVAEMKPAYLEWVDGFLAELDEIIAGTEGAEDFADNRYRRAYDLSNQVRNLGETFEYAAATQVANSFCELLFRLGEGRIFDKAALVEHLNALKLVCTPRFAESSAEGLDGLLAMLGRLVQRYPDPDAALREELERQAASLVKK